MFKDRLEAGRLLADILFPLRDSVDHILAIPRGGVVIGKVISDKLGKPLGVVNARKIPTPGQPELASGAHIIGDRGFGVTPDIKERSVVLTDDGIATGATMEAAIKYLKTKGVKKITVAVPVAPEGVINNFKKSVDKFIVLAAPDDFRAVGEFYEVFPQVSDLEVLQLLQWK